VSVSVIAVSLATPGPTDVAPEFQRAWPNPDNAGKDHEIRLHGQRLARPEQARRAVMDWMAFYNRSCLHSALGYTSPMQLEKRWLAAQHQPAAR
jgi:transposase InsO family protein